MTPVEIEALVGGLILLIQLVNQQIGDATGLTEEEKAAFVARIQAAQTSVPEWK